MSDPAVVLVIDDDAELRETVRMILDRDGHRTVGAGDGKEALAMLRGAAVRPSLILLDLMMPGMNGWEFCEAQRDDPELREIPVVGFTAGRDATRHPPNLAEVLLKPMRLEELVTVVRRYVRRPTA